MDLELTKNPYEHYEMTVQKFKDTVTKKKEMEETFHPNMVKDYNNVKFSMVETAVELLKLGVSSRLDDESVYFTIDDDEYKIARADIMKSINKKQWDALFPTDNVQTIKAEIDFGKAQDSENDSETSYNEEQPVPIMPGMDMNPFASFITAICAPFMANANQSQQLDLNQFSLAMQNAFQPPKELSDEVGGIQRKIIKLEKQRDEAVESVKNYQSRIEAIQNEYAENEENFKATVNEVNEKFERLESETKDLKNKLSSKEDDLRDAQRDKENFQKVLRDQRNHVENLKREQAKAIDELKNKYEREIKEAANKTKAAEEELKTSVQKIKDESSKEIDAVKDQLKAVEQERNNYMDACKKSESDIKRAQEASADKDRKVSDLEKRLKDYENKAKAYEDVLKEKERLDKELKEKLQEIESLKAEVEAGKKSKSELLEKLKQREQENKTLEELAYHDRKIGILNTNAFNRDFPKVDMNKTNLIITGIRNMKAINDKYGRDSGDQLIKVAAKACVDVFGSENVYRVFGDEFAIVSNDDYKDIINMIATVRDELESQQISMVFGISEGKKCKNVKEMVDVAEKAMSAMKYNTQTPAVQEAAIEEDKAADEPEEVDMSDMLGEYFGTEN